MVITDANLRFTLQYLFCLIGPSEWRCKVTRVRQRGRKRMRPPTMLQPHSFLRFASDDLLRCGGDSCLRSPHHKHYVGLCRGPQIDAVTFAGAKLLLFFELTKKNAKKIYPMDCFFDSANQLSCPCDSNKKRQRVGRCRW